MIEDVARDAELVDHELNRGGLACRFKHVDASEAFFRELKQHPPDVILSDHGLPSIDGFTMLRLVRDRFPDLPFIFVTGSIGEEMVIKAFENGATDCVLKHQLGGLVPAVRRALREAEGRRALRAVEAERDRLAAEVEALKAREARAGDANRLLPICSSCKKIRDEQDEWQPLESHLHKHLGVVFSHGFCPDCVQKYFTGFA